MLRTDLAHDKLSDLMLRPSRRADSALHLDRRATVAGYDLDLVKDRDAVGQAVWLSLAIPRGELTQLGHPNFGSRLHLLIGELMTETTLTRSIAYIREALRGDPRFKLRDIVLTRNVADPGAIDVAISVDPEATLVFDLQSLIAGEGAPP
ncbi:MAG: hypothetical protein AAF674_06750 [Pseudomonadota bacterium]